MTRPEPSPPPVRTLTEAEAALCAHVFGDAVDPEPVRILFAPLIRWAFVPGRAAGRFWIVWPREQARPDFADPATPLSLRAVFVHELVHVQQAQAGVNLLLAKLRAGDHAGAYAYSADGPAWADMTIEQQASAVEHAYRLSCGETAPCTAEDYRRLAPFPCGLSRAP